MALNGFEGAELRYASGLFNLMRNLGGAIGIAVVNTWLQDSARIQAARMGESLGEAGRRRPTSSPASPARIGQRHRATPPRRCWLARGEFARLVGRYALTSAFDEVFRTMAWMFLAALVMVPFCKPPAAAAPPPRPPTPTETSPCALHDLAPSRSARLWPPCCPAACAVGPDYRRPSCR